MTLEVYNKMLRVLGTIMAVVFWVVSMNFSYDGFNINVPNMAWVGIVLAVGVTVVQLIWNKQGMGDNLTLAVAGLMCYGYGIFTNVSGILNAQGYSWATVGENPFSVAFPAVLGIFLEVVPEPLLVWGLVGMTGGGDFLSNIFGTARNNQPQQQNNRQEQFNGYPQQQSSHRGGKQEQGHGRRTEQPSYPTLQGNRPKQQQTQQKARVEEDFHSFRR